VAPRGVSKIVQSKADEHRDKADQNANPFVESESRVLLKDQAARSIDRNQKKAIGAVRKLN
jgi:hypothetical protein